MFESCISFGKYGQWVAAITGAATGFISGNLASWPAAALPKIDDGTAGFTLTTDEQSWLVSMIFVGAAMSAMPCSYLMDRFGRRTILQIATIIGIISWIITLSTHTVELLCLARFLGGVHCGIEYTVVSNFIAESVDPEIRGRFGSLIEIMYTSGALFISFVSFFEYTTIALICLANSTVLFVSFLFLPETPYFHLMRGQREEAEKSYKWLKGSCVPENLNRVEEAIQEQLRNSTSYFDIFWNRGTLKAFGMVSFLEFIAASSSSVFLVSYAPLIIPSSWVTSQESYVVLCLSWVCAGLITSLFIDRFNRRTVMVFSCSGAATGLILISTWYYLRDFTTVDTRPTNWLPLLLVGLVGVFETFGMNNVQNIYKGEVFPINVKSKASALSCIVAIFFEGINTYVYFPINENIGAYCNFVKCAITAVIGIFFSWLILVETKSKSLEEIQDVLNRKKAA